MIATVEIARPEQAPPAPVGPYTPPSLGQAREAFEDAF